MSKYAYIKVSQRAVSCTEASRAHVEKDRHASLANLLDVFRLDQRWVVDGTDFDESFVGEVEDVSSTEAVTDSCELLDTF